MNLYQSMKLNSLLIGLIAAIALFTLSAPVHAQSGLTLWYKQPAEDWNQALPIGNGRLGAMVFGSVQSERIQFNEDTLWTGVPRDYLNPNALETLPRVRQLLEEGKQREAEEAAWGMMSEPYRQEAYQPFGDVILTFPGHDESSGYRRSLDLVNAVARTSYQSGGVTYTREIFSSHPDQVMVMRIRADQPGTINCRIAMTCPHPNSVVRTRDDQGPAELILSGQLTDRLEERTGLIKPSALKFESRLQVRSSGGETVIDDLGATVRGADEVTLTLAAHTSYENFRDIGANPQQLCIDTLAPLAGKSYDELFETHVRDYRELFNRMSIDLGSSPAADDPTDVRIARFGERDDPALVALYYQFGRYLLIASSRPGSQPANLQGIWNQEINPPWESKWTVNINTEMNYWPAELCNLSETHEPLFDMLDDLTVSGGAVAEHHYGARGWVLHHNTDIWRGAAPINHTNHGIWMTGGAWLCQHLWMRYEFTRDEEFLKRAYPVMKGAALFFVDFLVEDPETGWLISTPSNSPEIGGLVAGPAMDHQIIRNLFTNCIEASQILDVDHELRATLRQKHKAIAPNQIGRHGQLQEWLEDKDDPQNQHRHVSHLWALHPGNEISPLTTPELAQACKVTLSHRGDGGTGWSKAWKVNFWARLHDGDHSYRMLTGLLSESTLPNMFDTHPPFQIDGNFGGISGITEMLIQSHLGEIHLLPALPSALPDGSVRGVCARGGFVLNIDWNGGELAGVTVHSKAGADLKLRYRDMVKTMKTEAGQTIRLNAGLEAVEG